MDYDYYKQRTQRLLISGFPVELVMADFMYDNPPCIRRHSHEEIELLFMIKGSANILCSEEILYINEDELLFINQNVIHQIMPAEHKFGVFCSILANPGFLFGFDQFELEKKYVQPIIANHTLKYMHITSQEQDYPAILSLFKQLCNINEAKEFGYEILAKACLLQLWKLLLDRLSINACQAKYLTTKQDEQRIKQAVLFIQEHFADPITLNDIADSILVSKSECCRCFKRVLDISPFEYLMKYRIMESTRLMQASPQNSISEIAGAVGFNNTSYYNKVFRRFMGCTPSEYRRR